MRKNLSLVSGLLLFFGLVTVVKNNSHAKRPQQEGLPCTASLLKQKDPGLTDGQVQFLLELNKIALQNDEIFNSANPHGLRCVQKSVCGNLYAICSNTGSFSSSLLYGIQDKLTGEDIKFNGVGLHQLLQLRSPLLTRNKCEELKQVGVNAFDMYDINEVKAQIGAAYPKLSDSKRSTFAAKYINQSKKSFSAFIDEKCEILISQGHVEARLMKALNELKDDQLRQSNDLNKVIQDLGNDFFQTGAVPSNEMKKKIEGLARAMKNIKPAKPVPSVGSDSEEASVKDLKSDSN